MTSFKLFGLRVQKNPFLKKAQPTGFFWVLLGYGLYWVFNFLFEREAWKLVGWFSSSAKLLFRYTSILEYLKIRKFVTYWSLKAVNIKKSLIITSVTNEIESSLVQVFC